MPASLGQLNTNRARLEKHFDDGESFFVEYRPANLTPRQLHAINAVEGRAWADLSHDEQVAVMESTTRVLADTLIATDATTSGGAPIVCTWEGLQDVSYADQAALLALIQDDQTLGKSTGSEMSPASSTPGSASLPSPDLTASPPSPNGTSTSPSPTGSASPSPTS